MENIIKTNIKTYVLATCLLFRGAYAFGAARSSLNEETLRDLAPRITLEEAGISSFLVEGTIDLGSSGFRFVVAGMEPDHVTVRFFDLRMEPRFWQEQTTPP